MFSNRTRPVHLGPFPMELLPRAGAMPALAALRDRFPAPSATPLGRIVNQYIALFEQFRAEPPAPERAPYRPDPQQLADELKANCYFLNASLVGCCAIPDSAWTGARIEAHGHALAVVVEFGRDPEPDNLAASWVRGSEYDCALLRAAEIALISAAFLRRLGLSATAHTREASRIRAARHRPPGLLSHVGCCPDTIRSGFEHGRESSWPGRSRPSGAHRARSSVSPTPTAVVQPYRPPAGYMVNLNAIAKAALIGTYGGK